MVAFSHDIDALLTARRFPISSHVMPGIVVMLDSISILAAALITYVIILGDPVDASEVEVAAVVFVWTITLLLMNFAGLYTFEPILRPFAFSDKIILAFTTTFLFLLAAAFSIKISETFSRLWVGSFAIAACVSTLGVRVIAAQVIKLLTGTKLFVRNVVVVGTGDQAQGLLSYLNKSPSSFLSIHGLFGSPDPNRQIDFGRYPILGSMDAIDGFVRTHPIHDVIIAMPWSADQEIMTLMNKLRELPVNVYLSADLVGFHLPFRPSPAHFGNLPLVEVMGQPLAGWGVVRKALLDYSLGALLMLLALPLMALIALAIRLDSKGPIIYRQKRYGFVNKAFDIYKFRTMRIDTGDQSKTVQATENDPRVTRVGRYLRRMSLDELPQLFNVLNGTMSIVGPRPHAVDHNEEYARMIRGYFARHCVKPGITGWAQVNGLRGETKTVDVMEARVQHDIFYVENWSLFFDLQILAMTAIVCLTGRNAY